MGILSIPTLESAAARTNCEPYDNLKRKPICRQHPGAFRHTRLTPSPNNTFPKRTCHVDRDLASAEKDAL